MLVAPVVEQGMTKKLLYLPEGTWYDYDTREKYTGKQYIVKDAPLDVCPVFVKAGSIIPCFEPMQYVGEIELDTLILDVYPGEDRYVHYQDNGEDFTYQDGVYNEYEMTITKDETLTVRMLHKGYEKVYKKFVICYKGRKNKFAFNGEKLTVWLS